MEKKIKRITDILVKNGLDTYFTDKLSYNHIIIEYIEIDGNKLMYEDDNECMVTLTDTKAIDELFNEIIVNFNEKNIWELSMQDVITLAKSVVWNSMFYSDYENSFGVPAVQVSNFCDGFLDDLSDEFDTMDDVFSYILANTNVAGERFYSYIQSVEM